MLNETEDNHESFGLLGISRSSCNPPMTVFGSSVKTSNPITLRVSKAKRYRSLNRNTYHPTETIVEIVMSPSQFANAITSLNMGDSTTVTIDRIAGKRMEPYQEVSNAQLFEDEFQKDMMGVSNRLRTLVRKMRQAFAPRGNLKVANKEEMMSIAERVEQDIRANFPFVLKQFNRSMDKTTSDAKAEIEAFIDNKMKAIGKESIEQKDLLVLTGGVDGKT